MTYGAGNKRERLVIFAALLQHKEVAPLQSKLSDLFRDRVQDVEGWEYGLQEIQGRGLNTKIVEYFHHKLMEVAPGEARSNMEVLTKIARTGVNRESPEEYSLLRRLRVLLLDLARRICRRICSSSTSFSGLKVCSTSLRVTSTR